MNAMPPSRQVNHGRNIHDRHKRAAKMLGFALAADAPDTWQSFATVMTARLTARERGSIATMMLDTLPDVDFWHVIRVTSRGSKLPMPPLDDLRDYARLWAAGATEAERKSYMLAAYLSLPKAERRKFSEFVAGDLA